VKRAIDDHSYVEFAVEKYATAVGNLLETRQKCCIILLIFFEIAVDLA
jgi:hypothetical protein